MTHRRFWLLVSVVLIVGLLGPVYPLRADGITVVESAVSHRFAQRATFKLEATSTADITQVHLFFHALGDEQTEVVEVPLEEPAPEIDLEHVRDLRLFPLPPFATVTYWWQIEDATGNRLKTDPQQFDYTDNRFQWEHLDDDGVNVYWIEGQGDLAFGQAALDIARVSLTDIGAELRAPLPASIDVYIYDTQHNLDAAMLLTGRDWVSGQARPELGVVVIYVPFQAGYTSRMKRYIPHEITHLLVYQLVTPMGYKYVPEWLDEGLATVNERLPTPEHTLALEEAREAGQLLPLEDLCVPFSPNADVATLAYAQSASVVRFIRERYGADGIRRLMAAYANGAGCAGGVEEALNVTSSRLEATWRASLGPGTPWRARTGQVGGWVGLWLLTLLVAVPMIGGLRRQ